MSFTCWKYSRSTSSMSRRPLVSWKRHIRDKRAHTGVNTQAAQLMQLPRYTTGLHHTSSCSRVDARTRNSARLTTSVCVSVSMSVCTPAALSQAGALCTRLHPQEAARMPRLLHATWHTVLPARESLASKGRQRIMAACVETRHTAAVRRFCFVVLLFFFFLFFFGFATGAHTSVFLSGLAGTRIPPHVEGSAGTSCSRPEVTPLHTCLCFGGLNRVHVCAQLVVFSSSRSRFRSAAVHHLCHPEGGLPGLVSLPA